MAKEPSEHTVISWKAPEFLHYKKDVWWFPVQAGVTVLLTGYFILTKQYLVAIIVILGAIIIYQVAHQEPEILPVTFTVDGIRFKGKTILFSNIKTFWIVETEHAKQLYLQQTERLSSPVVIPLIKQDIDKVRGFLSHYIPETPDVKESFAEKMNRVLKI
jgi:hypothetical protein